VTSTLSMTAVRKLLDEIVILYIPGGIARSAIKPASLVSPTNSDSWPYS